MICFIFLHPSFIIFPFVSLSVVNGKDTLIGTSKLYSNLTKNLSEKGTFTAHHIIGTHLSLFLVYIFHIFNINPKIAYTLQF